MTTVIISLGSNAPDREECMAGAMKWLATVIVGARFSRVYETPEYSGRYPAYFNCVAEGMTALDADTLNVMLKEYERSAGRTPESKLTGIVPIDIDIVEYGERLLRPVEFEREYFAIGYRQLRGKDV